MLIHPLKITITITKSCLQGSEIGIKGLELRNGIVIN